MKYLTATLLIISLSFLGCTIEPSSEFKLSSIIVSSDAKYLTTDVAADGGSVYQRYQIAVGTNATLVFSPPDKSGSRKAFWIDEKEIRFDLKNTSNKYVVLDFLNQLHTKYVLKRRNSDSTKSAVIFGEIINDIERAIVMLATNNENGTHPFWSGLRIEE